MNPSAEAAIDRLVAAYRAEAERTLTENAYVAHIIGDLIAQTRLWEGNRLIARGERISKEWLMQKAEPVFPGSPYDPSKFKIPKKSTEYDYTPQTKVGRYNLAFDHVRAEADDYLKTYKTDLIEHGGTKIDGVPVNWLENHTRGVRDAVGTVIEDGIKEGWSKATVTQHLGTVLDKTQSQLKTIAHTEMMRVQHRGAMTRYEKAGIETVFRISGPNACKFCAGESGREYKITEVPEDHPNGSCDFVPNIKVPTHEESLLDDAVIKQILDGTMTAKIDAKTIADIAAAAEAAAAKLAKEEAEAAAKAAAAKQAALEKEMTDVLDGADAGKTAYVIDAVGLGTSPTKAALEWDESVAALKKLEEEAAAKQAKLAKALTGADANKIAYVTDAVDAGADIDDAILAYDGHLKELAAEQAALKKAAIKDATKGAPAEKVAYVTEQVEIGANAEAAAKQWDAIEATKHVPPPTTADDIQATIDKAYAKAVKDGIQDPTYDAYVFGKELGLPSDEAFKYAKKAEAAAAGAADDIDIGAAIKKAFNDSLAKGETIDQADFAAYVKAESLGMNKDEAMAASWKAAQEAKAENLPGDIEKLVQNPAITTIDDVKTALKSKGYLWSEIDEDAIGDALGKAKFGTASSDALSSLKVAYSEAISAGNDDGTALYTAVLKGQDLGMSYDEAFKAAWAAKTAVMSDNLPFVIAEIVDDVDVESVGDVFEALTKKGYSTATINTDDIEAALLKKKFGPAATGEIDTAMIAEMNKPVEFMEPLEVGDKYFLASLSDSGEEALKKDLYYLDDIDHVPSVDISYTMGKLTAEEWSKVQDVAYANSLADINYKLHTGIKLLADELKHLKVIQSSIKKSTIEGGYKLFRGVGDEQAAVLRKLKVGDKYIDKGILSFDFSQNRALSHATGSGGYYSEKTLIRITTQDGEAARFVDRTSLTVLYENQKNWQVVAKNVVLLPDPATGKQVRTLVVDLKAVAKAKPKPKTVTGLPKTVPVDQMTPIPPGHKKYLEPYSDSDKDAVKTLVAQQPKWTAVEKAYNEGDLAYPTYRGIREFRYLGSSINYALVTGNKLDAAQKETLKAIRGALEYMTVGANRPVVRGVGEHEAMALIKAKIGSKYSYKGVSSFSCVPNTAIDKASNLSHIAGAGGVDKVVMRTMTKDGEPAIYLGGDDMAVLFGDKKPWRIVDKNIVEMPGPYGGTVRTLVVDVDTWVDDALIKAEPELTSVLQPDIPVPNMVPLKEGDRGFVRALTPSEQHALEKFLDDKAGYGDEWASIDEMVRHGVITGTERDAINRMQNVDYRDVNHIMNGGDVSHLSDRQIEEIKRDCIEVVRGALARGKGSLTDGRTIYRGVGARFGDVLYKSKVGDVVSEENFQAYSLSQNTSFRFALKPVRHDTTGGTIMPIMMRTKTSKSQTGRYLTSFEQEVLMQGGSEWKVAAKNVVDFVDPKSGKTYRTLIVDVVHPDDFKAGKAPLIEIVPTTPLHQMALTKKGQKGWLEADRGDAYRAVERGIERNENREWDSIEANRQRGKLNGDEFHAADTYRGSAFKWINGFLRDLSDYITESYKQQAAGITPFMDTAILKSRVPAGFVVKRGVGRHSARELVDLRIGDTYIDKGYSSFSHCSETSLESYFAKEISTQGTDLKVLIRYKTRDDEGALFVGTSEMEIIYPRGKKWIIVDKHLMEHRGGNYKGKLLVVDVIAG